MAGGDGAGEDFGADEIAVGAFGGEVDGGRGAFLAAGDFAQPEGLAEPAFCGADEDEVVGGGEGVADGLGCVFEDAEAADGGGGEDRAAFGFVVEGDVAGDDGEIQRDAGGGDAADAGGELAHDSGFFGVGEVHVVGDRQGEGAGGGDVAPGFGYGLGAAGFGVGEDVARGAVGGQGQGAASAF